VVNALTYVEGGLIEERVDKLLQELGGTGKLKVPLWSIELGGSGRRQVEQEVHRKRTAHAAIGELLQRLQISGDLHRIPDLDVDANPEAGRELRENDLIEFSGDIQIWPPPVEVTPDPPPFLKRLGLVLRGEELPGPELRVAKQFVATVPIGQLALAILPLRAEYLVSRRVTELARRVTVVGQLDTLAAKDQHFCLCTGDGRWDPELRPRDAACPDSELGAPEWALSDGPWALVRPLCIFK
jgi:hypothetical protein